MARTTIKVTVRVVVDHQKDIDPVEVINECAYAFDSQTIGADIVDTEMIDVEL